jgi:hypothetical protein
LPQLDLANEELTNWRNGNIRLANAKQWRESHGRTDASNPASPRPHRPVNDAAKLPTRQLSELSGAAAHAYERLGSPNDRGGSSHGGSHASHGAANARGPSPGAGRFSPVTERSPKPFGSPGHGSVTHGSGPESPKGLRSGGGRSPAPGGVDDGHGAAHGGGGGGGGGFVRAKRSGQGVASVIEEGGGG